MDKNPNISNTGFWYSDDNIFHVRCEPLCDWIIDFLTNDKERILYDFGCGNGQYLSKLHDNGFSKLCGFDGTITLSKEFDNISVQDLTKPLIVNEFGNCLCLEVAEHIPAKYESVFINNIVNACNNYLIMSWAIRGQDGWGHVNCVNNDEAISKLEKSGMIYLPNETASCRNNIPNDNPYFWFKNTTLIFKKQQ